MQARESNSTTDYIYYPVAYPNNALATITLFNNFPHGNEYLVPWVKLIDRTKFVHGIGADFVTGGISTSVLSVGF